MPRSLRLILPGVAVHIIQRGNHRAACFQGDSDYLIYLAYLRQLADKYHCAVHAYCLMKDHVHLLLTPQARGACTALMRDLGQRYCHYFNDRHERTGALWDGRFRACIVQSALYVLGCYRYIESNPVRARMVDHPTGYLWSSYAVNSGMRSDPLITRHADYIALAADAESRQAAYRALFDERLGSEFLKAIRDATNAGYALVSEAFKRIVLARRGYRTEDAEALYAV